MRTQLRYLALWAAIASVSTFSYAQAPATGSATAGAQSGQASQSATAGQSGSAGQRGSAGNPGSTGGQNAAGGLSGANSQNATNRPGAAGATAGAQAVAGGAGQGQGGMNLSAFLAHKLERGNEAEIELGKLAGEKAQNDSVKKFAQMMVQHHTEMLQKIKQANIGAGQPGQGGQPGLRQRVGQSEPSTRNAPNVRNSESNVDGQGTRTAASGGSQASTLAGQTPGQASPGAATTGNPGINPNATAAQAGQVQAQGQGRGRGAGNRVPQQLVAILDQTCDTELQMTKEMLGKHEGQDFDMGYIGLQIVKHTCMLAELQAIKNSGPQDLQQLVTEGEEVTRQHLEEASKIAHSLKDKGDK